MLNFGEGVGRIIRELDRPECLLEKPKCDIAVKELLVLSRDPADLDLRMSGTGHPEVEILPCVVHACRSPFFGSNSAVPDPDIDPGR